MIGRLHVSGAQSERAQVPPRALGSAAVLYGEGSYLDILQPRLQAIQ